MKVQGAFPVTMLPGDGVGPELMHAVKEVFKVSSLWRGMDGRAACRNGWVESERSDLTRSCARTDP